MKQNQSRGFTLIELMITVTVVAILVAVAFPSYSAYMRRAARTAAQNFLSDLAQREELRFQNTRTYSNTLAGLSVTSVPSDVSDKYQTPQFTVVDPAAGQLASFHISISPISGGGQAVDGSLIIQSDGNRCRRLSGAVNTACTASDKRWDEK